MLILDMDLDFFFSAISKSFDEGRRPDKYYTPWSNAEVRQFLENNCGLNKNNPIPGKIVETHDECFWIWKEMIASRTLIPPVDVVHIDAHADLGSGDSSYIYIFTDILNKPIEERHNPESRYYINTNDREYAGISEGNYLSFAIACR